MNDIKQSLGRIATFYSYKGGTGRSMALANFAWIMAASGKRVLAIDWDLEAPGLHRYFRPFLVDPDLFETDGLIDTFWMLTASALEKVPVREGTTADKDSTDVVEAFEDAKRRLDWSFPSGGYIDFIGAGRQGGTYSERVNSFDWKRFYELGGAHMLSAAKAHLRTHYDWVLIDSRTGVSDTSGICTIQMPQMVVACFTLNRQSIDGVAAILRSIRTFRSSSVDGSAIDLFPLATRIENAEQRRLEVARSYARSTLVDFLPKMMQTRPREYWDKMEISYRPAYAFEEVLAAFGDATGAAGAADTMLAQVEATAQWIADDDTLRLPEIVEEDRASVLAKYALGDQPAPVAPVTGDTNDTVFLRSIRAKEQLWRTSKFQWRYLLSRREIDLLTDTDKKEFGRNMAYYLTQSERMQRLSRSTQTVSPLAFILFLIVSSAFFLSNGEFRYELSRYYYQPLILPAIIAAWCLWVFAWSIFAAQDRPHGITISQVIMLVFQGPFHYGISDYDPSDKPTMP